MDCSYFWPNDSAGKRRDATDCLVVIAPVLIAMSHRLVSQSREKDCFDFVFQSEESEECIKEKGVLVNQFGYNIDNYVVQKNPSSDPVGYTVYKEEIDMTDLDGLAFLAAAYSHWIHHSCLNHYHGVRAIAFRTLPVIPPARQAALQEYLKIETPTEQQKQTVRASLREVLGSSKLQVAIVMEEVEGTLMEKINGKTSGWEFSYSSLMTMFLYCFVALNEVHQLGLVLDAFDLRDFVVMAKTHFVKLINHGYTKQRNKPTDTTYRFERMNSAPELALNWGAATIKSDVYILAELLDTFLILQGPLFVQSTDELAALRAGFLGPMLRRNPDERPTVDQILTEERFTRYFAHAGVPSLAEIEHIGKEMYERAAVKYHLSKEVSTAETVAANLALCRSGQVKLTLTQQRDAIHSMPGDSECDAVHDVHDRTSERFRYTIARSFCCPCFDKGLK